MKKYTKLMGILLALVMLIALVPMTAMADDPTYPPNTDAPGTMNLVIIKRVYGLDETQEYKFNFKYYQIKGRDDLDPVENGVKGEFSITAKWDGIEGIHLGSYTIENLPQYTWIAIEEIDPIIPEGYRLSAPDIETIYTEPYASETRYIDNNYKKRKDCDIVISKTVEGSGANANDEFEFEITFYMPKEEYEPPVVYSMDAAAQVNVPPAIGAAVPGIYKILADGSIYDFEREDYDAFPDDEEGKVTGRFKLKHGESLYIMNAADRTEPVTVTELDSKGYSTVVNGVSGTKWETNAPNTDTVSVNFVNTKGATEVSDSITVEKKWSDGNEKHMRESVTV